MAWGMITKVNSANYGVEKYGKNGTEWFLCMIPGMFIRYPHEYVIWLVSKYILILRFFLISKRFPQNMTSLSLLYDVILNSGNFTHFWKFRSNDVIFAPSVQRFREMWRHSFVRSFADDVTNPRIDVIVLFPLREAHADHAQIQARLLREGTGRDGIKLRGRSQSGHTGWFFLKKIRVFFKKVNGIIEIKWNHWN